MTVDLPGMPTDGEQYLEWGNDVVRLVVAHGPDSAPRLVALWHADEPRPDLAALRRSALPVLEVAVLGEGRSGTSGKRHVDGAVAQRLRLTAHREGHADGTSWLEFDLAEEPVAAGAAGTSAGAVPGLRATVTYQAFDGVPAVRSSARITATSTALLDHATTGVLSGLGHGARWEDELAVWEAANPWSGEFRWRRSTLVERGLYDVGMTRYGQVGAKNRITLTSTGAWSTAEHLAQGMVEDARTGRMVAWQVETNGAWHAELGDRYDDVYLLVTGPTALEHQWAGRVGPGAFVETVPVSLAVVPGHASGTDATLGACAAVLTTHRRRGRRAHPDHERLPVIYNDFLNGLMSDPTTERVLPLVEAAADLGAEYYVMDAGWYDDEFGGWWDSVGAWEPSVNRFPGGGLRMVLDRVRELGMRPGLWLEPEMVGVRSPVAGALPPEAFFRRHGRRVTEWGRHQLDLRHPAARAHLDAVVDRLVGEFGLAYLKFDHNVDIGPGTDGGRPDAGAAAGAPEPAGNGLLGQGRAFLSWAAAVMDRHPGLVVEGCAAGGSRTDAASGAVFPIQSLTDQQDFRLTPPIAAAAAFAIPPEQAGVWASADGAMDAEEIAFSLVTALTSRVHLAGRIDTLDGGRRDVVRQGLAVHRALRAAVARSVPVWPLGLPGWRDRWIAAGARDGNDLYLAVWRRDGVVGGGPAGPGPSAGDRKGDTVRLPLPGLIATGEAEVLYPTWGGESVSVVDGGTAVELKLPILLAARLLHLRVTGGERSEVDRD
ncbi:glycoside hydrolase family 36 protein [Myceligenerans pegani]|uniref:Alpha-galactosidase n=1 Tax=Myceligenerans pegani TaxID=2776917 RepID=A0ABR9N5T6_9MICO|nr:glycoside hydrolase family 36 protein [Myceligenerans sp. TRM 65318]MBE1879033.1 alpha-galactosidase [Myceligenerans sp. TRM 65318]MBE3021304.1 alpha-galactosidase [Myceligenerans sp. TRM 65318]